MAVLRLNETTSTRQPCAFNISTSGAKSPSPLTSTTVSNFGAIAYVVQKPDVDQSSFTDALSRLGYEIKSKELRLRPDGTAKGDWDMGIAIDSIAIAPKLDTVVLVSGDGDFAPLVEMLKAHGCRVEVVSFRRSTAVELIDAATQYTAIEESMLFKEKKFQKNDPSNE